MNFPAHMTIELDDQDRADLAATRTAFIREMQKLSPAQQVDRATVIAGGLRPADPYTRALAQQVLDGEKLRGRITSAQAELKQLERDLRTGGVVVNERGDAFKRQAALKEGLELDQARLIALHEERHDTAQRKAVVQFRADRAERAKAEALSEAVTRKKAELEAETVDQLAEKIARAQLAKTGRPAPKHGDSQ
jgi:hypothetical protein